MPYRFHPTKRALYQLLAEKSAELSWLDLPKSSEVLLAKSKHSAWLRWPYHEVYFTPIPIPMMSVSHYETAPSDEIKRVRHQAAFDFPFADWLARGIFKEIPAKE